jgi:hypothetical protein
MSLSFELCALITLPFIIGDGAYICSLEYRAIVLGEALDAANAPNHHRSRLTILLGGYEVSQGAFETSENTIHRLSATSDTLESKMASLKTVRVPSNPHHDCAALQQMTIDLWRQLTVAKSRLQHVHATCDDKTDQFRSLLATTDLSRVE